MRGAGQSARRRAVGLRACGGFDMYLRMLEETVRRLMSGDAAPKLVPSDVTIDTPNYLPDDYVVSQDAKIDVYKRLARFEDPREIEALRTELRDRFGPLPRRPKRCSRWRNCGSSARALGIEGILVRGDEARITFRDSAAPRIKGLSAAFHDVQFQAEVRRAVPLVAQIDAPWRRPDARRSRPRASRSRRLTHAVSDPSTHSLWFSSPCAFVPSLASPLPARSWPPVTGSRKPSPRTSTSSRAPARRSCPSTASATCSATPRSRCR